MWLDQRVSRRNNNVRLLENRPLRLTGLTAVRHECVEFVSNLCTRRRHLEAAGPQEELSSGQFVQRSRVGGRGAEDTGRA